MQRQCVDDSSEERGRGGMRWLRGEDATAPFKNLREFAHRRREESVGCQSRDDRREHIERSVRKGDQGSVPSRRSAIRQKKINQYLNFANLQPTATKVQLRLTKEQRRTISNRMGFLKTAHTLLESTRHERSKTPLTFQNGHELAPAYKYTTATASNNRLAPSLRVDRHVHRATSDEIKQEIGSIS